MKVQLHQLAIKTPSKFVNLELTICQAPNNVWGALFQIMTTISLCTCKVHETSKGADIAFEQGGGVYLTRVFSP